jgi:hypothetical protein
MFKIAACAGASGLDDCFGSSGEILVLVRNWQIRSDWLNRYWFAQRRLQRGQQMSNADLWSVFSLAQEQRCEQHLNNGQSDTRSLNGG